MSAHWLPARTLPVIFPEIFLLDFRIVLSKRQHASESCGNLEGVGPSSRSSDIRNLLLLANPPGDLATCGPHTSGWLILSIYLCQPSWEQANYIPFSYHTSVAKVFKMNYQPSSYTSMNISYVKTWTMPWAVPLSIKHSTLTSDCSTRHTRTSCA